MNEKQKINNGETQRATRSISNKVVNKSVSTGKTILSYLTEPIKAKYTKVSICKNLGIRSSPDKGRFVTNFYEKRQAIFFKRIFGNANGDIKFIYNDNITFPYNGVYFKKLDKYTVVICTIKDKYNEDEDDGVTTRMEFRFIGLNAQKMYNKIEAFSTDHYYSLSDRLGKETKQKCVRSYNNFNFNETLYNIKSFDDLILKDDVKKKIIGALDRYKANIELYEKYKIKHNLGALLWGPPGTGKSSLAYTIALYLGYPIVVLSPEFIYNHSIDNNGTTPLSDLGDNSKRVVLIEEIDCMMGGISVDKEGTSGGSGVLRRDHILKFIDGLPTGTVLIANTNHYNKLDEALKRSGRFDIKEEIEPFEMKEVIKMTTAFGIEETFADRYSDKLPVCPSTLQFDLVEELSIRLMNGTITINE